MAIKLKYCTVERTDFGVTTRFPDGTETSNWPPDTDHFRWCAKQCLYGSDVKEYCFQHDLMHAWLAEYLFDKESGVLWNSAHGLPMVAADYEEHIVWLYQTMQADWPAGMPEAYNKVLTSDK